MTHLFMESAAATSISCFAHLISWADLEHPAHAWMYVTAIDGFFESHVHVFISRNFDVY